MRNMKKILDVKTLPSIATVVGGPRLVMRAAGNSVTGKRPSNEDAFLLSKEHVFVVADGMGGHAAGEVASKMAIDDIKRRLRNGIPADVGSFLTFATQGIHQALLNHSAKHPETAGMGTTFTALCLRGHKGYVAHVGDSRCYLLRDGMGSQLTVDHTAGGHVITNCLGAQVQSHRTTQILQVDLQAGDIFVLCSDGLSDYLSAIDVAMLKLREPKTSNNPSHFVGSLIAAALNAGGADNITVIVVEILNKE